LNKKVKNSCHRCVIHTLIISLAVNVFFNYFFYILLQYFKKGNFICFVISINKTALQCQELHLLHSGFFYPLVLYFYPLLLVIKLINSKNFTNTQQNFVSKGGIIIKSSEI